jgi:8-oxo-dGTP pyrophosphatase MutT (NUDIX family)
MARILAGLKRLASRTNLPVRAAAVCYRQRDTSIEFLLVKTSSGKWTFPKGRLSSSMSASESAAREAWEEAGVRGRVAERHFGSYLDSKRTLGSEPRAREFRIVTFLLEVHSTVDPQESGRKPTWFAPRTAKRCLAEGRSSTYATQIASIVDSALEHLNTIQNRRSRLVLRAQRRQFVPAG